MPDLYGVAGEVGYPLENRSFSNAGQRYKFTGKERDKDLESNYDYFGARYYDSRIGRWNGVEPLLDKYVGVTPYCYSLCNPISIKDFDGKDPRRNQMANVSEIVDKLNDSKGSTIESFIVSELAGNENPRYVYTESDGFIDLLHFFTAASVSGKGDIFSTEALAEFVTIVLGNLMEDFQDNQKMWGDESAWDPEDSWSNVSGAMFGTNLNITESLVINDEFINKFSLFMNLRGAVDKNDPTISREKVRIRENQEDDPLPQRKYVYKPYYGEPVRATPAN